MENVIDNNTITDEGNTVEDNQVDNPIVEPNPAEEKKFTQSDVDKLIGELRVKEREKTEEAIKAAVSEAIAEHDRLSKLSAEEKAKELKAKEDAEYQARLNQVTLRERRLEAQEALREKGVPVELVDFIVDLDQDKTNENIEKLAQVYAKSVEAGITGKLAGTPPPDFSSVQDPKPIDKRNLSAF